VPAVELMVGEVAPIPILPELSIYGMVLMVVPGGYPCRVSELRAKATVAICCLGSRVSAPTVTSNQTAVFSVKTSEEISAPQDVSPINTLKMPSWSGETEQVPEEYSSDPTVAASNSLKITLVLVVMGLSEESVSLPWNESCLVGAVRALGYALEDGACLITWL